MKQSITTYSVLRMPVLICLVIAISMTSVYGYTPNDTQQSTIPSHATIPPYTERTSQISTPNPKHIAIEAGHHKAEVNFFGAESCHEHDEDGYDIGKVYYEVENTVAVSQLAAEILRSYGHTVTVLEARRTNLVGLVADAFISLHNDYCEPGISGYQLARKEGKNAILSVDGTFMSGIKENDDPSDRLTIALWHRYGDVTQLPRIHAVTESLTDYYAWSRIDESTPGTIIEMGLWSEDEDMLLNQRGILAAGIAEGILDYLGQLDADDVRTLDIAQSQIGTISPASDQDSYYFDGLQGETVTIDMRSFSGHRSGLKATLSVYAPNGTHLNPSDSVAATIEKLVLPHTGRYRVIASSLYGQSTGAYQITLTTNNNACALQSTTVPYENVLFGQNISRYHAMTYAPDHWNHVYLAPLSDPWADRCIPLGTVYDPLQKRIVIYKTFSEELSPIPPSAPPILSPK
ncbi:MAG: hypothetical protein AAF639_26140 [Chloroflexota bacterium]